MLKIQNNQHLIASTNYWDSDYYKGGKFYLSVNAGAFRLLCPNLHKSHFFDMQTAKKIIIRIGEHRDYSKKMIELLFDDYTDDPYRLDLSLPEQIDRLPEDNKKIEKFKFLIYWKKQILKNIPKVCFFEYSDLPNLKSIKK